MCLLTAPTEAAELKAYFPFDGSVADSEGFVGSAFSGGSPTYGQDRSGAAGRAIHLNGTSQYLTLSSSAFPGDSNAALGLKDEFTIAAWMRMDNAGAGGDDMVIGNLGTGTGTLHFGVRNNGTPLAYYGMWGNDAPGQVTISTQSWYHVVWSFADGRQEMFLNGIPETVRPAANTTKAADTLIGTAEGTGRVFDGRLDDVAFFAGRLSASQIHALADGVSPDSLTDDYFGDPLPGPLGAPGQWGVRDIKSHPLPETSLVDAARIARTSGSGTVTNGTAPVVNFADPQAPASGGNFGGNIPYISNTGLNDDSFVTVAHGAVEITAGGDYTFGFSSDDGAMLRVLGQQFSGSTVLSGALRAAVAHQGDTLVVGSDPSSALGVVSLAPGIYSLEFLVFENGGGAQAEVFAAAGAKTAFDGTFRLVGDTANGGLPLVGHAPLVRGFGSDVEAVVDGNPAQVTLSWDSFFAANLSIDQGVGNVTGDSGSVTVPAPAATTTYTLTAVRGSETATAQVTVGVDPMAVVDRFVADDTQVSAGAPVTLSWATRFAASLKVDPGNIDVTGTTSLVVHPTASTTYTLTATGGGGSDSAQVDIVIGEGPSITSFTADDLQPEANPTVRLDWAASEFDTLSLDNGIGDVTTLDHVFVCPTHTTTYTLTATNGFGSTTAQVPINPTAPLGVDPDGRFTVRFAYPLVGGGSLAAASSTLAGGANITLTDVPLINYGNSAGGGDGEFGNDAAFPAALPDTFAMEATAMLNVNVGGSYRFGINNDDGGRLRIGGANVIVDDANHGPLTTVGSITLAPGSYLVEYLMFDSGGGNAAELFVMGPDGTPALLAGSAASPPIVTSSVIISELMASNDGDVIKDGDGDSEDWLELYNGTGSAVSLDNYFLTDDASMPRKWQFPAGTTIGAGEYLIVWASDKAAAPPAGEIHTNFRLGAGGEYLALIRADGATDTVVSAYAPSFPAQTAGVSYGTYGVGHALGYFVTPTPGGRNAFGYDGLVADTKFPTSERGFKSAPFEVTITTGTPDATILYTTDGSEPTFKDGGHGNVYTGPVAVSETTILRARAVREGFFPTNVDTQSYIFVDDVLTQDMAHAVGLGFPATAVKGQVFEYGMDSAVVAAHEAEVRSALLAIPTFSLAIDQHDFSSAESGIYVNALDQRGLEQPASLELLNEDGLGGGQFQENLGVRIRGGFSRSGSNPKHAFRFFFRKTYGAGKLDYPIFQDEGADEFDKFDLRTSQNYSWAFQNSSRNTFVREVFGRDTQRAMGQPYTRSRYYHLYINGHYWGLFQTQERAEADYGETYFGGDKSEYDTIKSAGSSGGYNTEAADGELNGDWRDLWEGVRALRTSTNKTAEYFALQGLAPDGVTPIADPVLLDVDNLIDYMLDIFYCGAFDTALSTFLNNASNNWFSVRNRVADDRGFAFFYHDGEHGMGTDGDTRSTDRTGPWGGIYGTIGDFNKSNPQYLHEDLATVPEYRVRFADRAYKHLLAPGGALTAPAVESRIANREMTVSSAIRAEQARWGNNSNLTKEAWANEMQSLRNWIANGSNQHFNVGRENVIISQLRAYNDGGPLPLYPSTGAPSYNHQGGFVPTGFSLVITDPNTNPTTVRFTTDGSDPRAVGGGFSPSAMTYSGPITLNASVTVRARALKGGVWSALEEATFIVGTTASASNLVVSEINYHPSDPTPTESAETYITGDSDFEFLEFLNISPDDTVDLSNAVVSGEIDYVFPVGTVLAPGARLFIVSNVQGFNFRYAGFDPLPVPLGEYSRKLDNSGGNLTLTGAGGTEIFSFNFDDADDWPASADGDGYTLVLASPLPGIDMGAPANWRSSRDLLGTPGTDEHLTSFADWATATGALGGAGADTDRDGLTHLMEFFLGGDPNIPSTGELPTGGIMGFSPGGIPGDFPTLTYRRSVTAAGVADRVEVSTDLEGWDSSDEAIKIDRITNLGDGTEEVVVRSRISSESEPSQFLRLRVTEQ